MAYVKAAMGNFKSSVEKNNDHEFKERSKELERNASQHPLTPTECYEYGMAWLNHPDSPFTVVFDPANKDFYYHTIRVKDNPEEIRGIDYSFSDMVSNFKPLRSARGLLDLTHLKDYLLEFNNSEEGQNLAKQHCHDFQTFWGSLLKPGCPNGGDLQDIGRTLLALYNESINVRRTEPMKLGHTFLSEHFATVSKHPQSFVPPLESFPKSVRDNVTLEQIFTIFPPAELALWVIWLGRVGVGPSNQIPDGCSALDVIVHYFRLGLIVLGNEAGVGKSFQLKQLRKALCKCGFTMEAIRTMGEQFGGARIYRANIAYKDDSDKKSATKFISSEITKMVVTNEEVIAENKFKEAFPLIPVCAICINANEINMDTVYQLDPGIVDRIKILKTYDRTELAERLTKVYPDPDYRPPSLEPAENLKWLSDFYQVSIECLMLWGLRMATDKFWNLVKDGDTSKLLRLHHHHSNRLRQTFMPDMRISTMKAMILSMFLTNRLENNIIPELSPAVLKRAIESYLKVHGGKVTKLSALMKADWDNNFDRNPRHHWQGFRDLSLPSVRSAYNAFDMAFSECSFDSDDSVKNMNKVIALLHTRGGQKLNGGYTHLAGDWNNARAHAKKLREFADSYLDALSSHEVAYLQDGLAPDLLWLDNPNYSPETAEIIRPTL